MSKLGGIALAVMAAAACSGGDETGGECTPGDSSRVGYLCSANGTWVQRSANDGQQAAAGASASSSSASEAGSGGTSATAGGNGGASSSSGVSGAGGVAGNGGTAGDGTGGGADAALACLSAGELDCSDAAPCCDDSMCISDGSVVVCAVLCTDANQCSSGCCAPVDALNSVCAPTNFCPPPAQTCITGAECSTGCCIATGGGGSICGPAGLCAPPPSVGCSSLVLLANDGTYLGDATSIATANSVCNEYGLYGSQYGVNSIHNPYGLYGGEFAVFSAYNPYTATPPVLYCVNSDSVLNAVSKNEYVSGSPIDPDALCAVLAANGI